MSDVVRKALEKAERGKEMEVRDALRCMQEILMKIPPEEIVSVVSVVRSSRKDR